MIKHLRQEPSDIDGIRRSQPHALVQHRVGKGLLHQPLAIVERARHFQCGDIFAERSELFFLRLADALRRIENHHANARHAQETMRHGATGVSRCCHQHGKRPRFAAHKITHQPGHEARAEILERQRRPVKQLQNVQSRRERNELHGKVDRLAHDLPEHFLPNIRSGKWPHHAETDFRERQPTKLLQFLRRMPRNLHRHVQPAVGCKPAQHRAAKRGERSLAEGAPISQ